MTDGPWFGDPGQHWAQLYSQGKERRDPWLPAEDDAGEDLEDLRPTVWDPNDDDPARDDLRRR